MKKNILIIILIILIGGSVFVGLKWYGAQKSAEEEEEMILPLLTTEQLKDDYNSARAAEEKIKGTDILYPYIQAGFYWKVLAEATQEEIFYKKTVDTYLAAIDRFDMQFYLPYANLAGIYQNLGENEKSEEMYKKAIQIVPGEAPLYIRLAELYRFNMNKSPEEVLAIFDEGMERVISTLPLTVAKAGYLKDIDRKEESLKLFEKIYQETKDGIYKSAINELRTELGMASI